jgi:hypothetical protein
MKRDLKRQKTQRMAMQMETENGVMLPEANKCQGMLEATGSWKGPGSVLP